MRVLLLRTSFPRSGKKPFDYPPVAAPLGIMSIAASLRARGRRDKVMVVDAAISLSTPADLAGILDGFRPDILGLSSLGYEEPLVGEFSAIARGCRPSMPIIVGGPLATSDPARVLAIPTIDLAVVGEGEETFVELVDTLSRGDDPSGVRGIALRGTDGHARTTPPRPFIKDLDALPPVNWEDIELPRYSEVLNFNDLPVRGVHALLLTSRGCPYRCIYCHCFYGSRVRSWSPGRLGEELERLARRHGVEEVHIGDDIFNHAPGRIEALRDEVRRRRLDLAFAFPNGIRGDRLGKRDIGMLAEAGCTNLCLAVETTSARLQRMIRKKLKVEKVFKAADECTRAGLLTQAFVMLGFPTETKEEMIGTVEAIVRSRFDIIRVFPVIPYPGTELFDLAVREGFDARTKLGKMFLEEHKMVNATRLPDEEFLEIIRWARSRVYEDPRRRERLRAFYRAFGRPDHPMFKRVHWTDILAGQPGAGPGASGVRKEP